MKKRGLAAALAMLTMATTGTAFAATNYWIVAVYYNNEGYNASTPVKKVIPVRSCIRQRLTGKQS